MCDKVSFYPEQERVSIDGKLYTKKELELKDKSKNERDILHSLKDIIARNSIKNINVVYTEITAKSYEGMMGNGSLI